VKILIQGKSARRGATSKLKKRSEDRRKEESEKNMLTVLVSDFIHKRFVCFRYILKKKIRLTFTKKMQSEYPFFSGPVHMTPELEPEPVHSLVFTPAFSVTFRHAIFQLTFLRPKVYFFDLIISQEVSRSHSVRDKSTVLNTVYIF